MKKNILFIFIATLILNLLPQISNAWKLDHSGSTIKLIYRDNDEKEDWEEYQLPHAIHSKLISQNTTVLDIAIMAEKEAQANPQDETIVHKIQNNKRHSRRKMFVKWERDNEYIDETIEKNWEITPSLRRTLLKEIAEEEMEKKENKNFSFKIVKTPLKIVSFGLTFGISKWIKGDINEAGKWALIGMTAVITAVEAMEAYCEWSWKKTKQLFTDKNDEEIKLPPLQNMPVLPKDYKKVNVYTYGL